MADRADWEDVDGILADAGAPASAEVGDVEDGGGGVDGLLDDDPFANAFTEEIMNVSASDWDVDADSLWGDDTATDLGIDPGTTAYDFPV